VTDEDASVSNVSMSGDGRVIFYREARSGRQTSPLVRTIVDTGERTVLADNAWDSSAHSRNGSGTTYAVYRPNDDGFSFDYALVWRNSNGRESLLSPWGKDVLTPTDVRRDDAVVLETRRPPAFNGPAALVEWPIGPATATEPRRVLLESATKQFWQGHYSPDGRWVSFVAHGLQRQGMELGIVPAGASRASTWTRIAADHPWPDKPRWSPDGHTLYFLSLTAGGFFELWGVRIDSDQGTPTREPFLLKRFDSPRWHIDTDLGDCEMGIANGQLVLPMQSVKGSIWLLANPGN